MSIEKVKQSFYNKTQIWPDSYPKIDVSSINLTDEDSS